MVAAGMQLSEQKRRRLEANVGKFYVYNFLVSFMLVAPIWVVFLMDVRGLRATHVASLEGFGGLVIAFAQIPTGAVADQAGRRVAMVIGGGLITIGVTLFALAQGYLLLLLMYLVWHIGLTFRSGADTALLYDTLKALGREHEYLAISGKMGSVGRVSVFAALVLGGLIAQFTNYTFPIYLTAGTVALTTLVMTTMEEAPFKDARVRAGYGQILRESTRTLRALPVLRWSLLYAAVVGTVVWVPTVFVPVFLRYHNVPKWQFGVFQAVSVAFAAVASYLAHRLVTKFGTWKVVLVTAVVPIVCYSFLAFTTSMWMYPAFVASGAAFAVVQLFNGDYINKRMPSFQRATLMSAGMMIACILIAAVGPVLGWLNDSVSMQAMFAAVAIGFAVVGAVNIALWMRAERAEEGVMAPAPGLAEAEAEATP